MLYANDPWPVIHASLARCRATERESAEAFVAQAKDYYRAGENALADEAKPLLFYYSFLNLAKALSLANQQNPRVVGKVTHGLGAGLGMPFHQAKVTAHPSGQDVSAFDEFLVALTGAGLTAKQDYPLQELMAQSVVGHRLWMQAANRRERFIGIANVLMMDSGPTQNQLWATVELRKAAVDRRGRTLANLLREADLLPDFESVKDRDGTSGVLRRFEQKVPTSYTHRGSDEVMSLVEAVKAKLWRTITATPPHRAYYLYMSPPGEVRLTQLASIYALMFYMGSVTRYYPTDFLKAIRSPYGGFLREFLASQPQQFVFGIACEFRRQEVSRAAVV